MHHTAEHYLARPHSVSQYLYDPGILPGFAN